MIRAYSLGNRASCRLLASATLVLLFRRFVGLVAGIGITKQLVPLVFREGCHASSIRLPIENEPMASFGVSQKEAAGSHDIACNSKKRCRNRCPQQSHSLFARALVTTLYKPCSRLETSAIMAMPPHTATGHSSDGRKPVSAIAASMGRETRKSADAIRLSSVPSFQE